MGTKLAHLFVVLCFLVAASLAVVGFGGPSGVLRHLGVSDTQSAAAAGDDSGVGAADTKTSGRKHLGNVRPGAKSSDARSGRGGAKGQRLSRNEQALAADGGTYGSDAGAGAWKALIAGAKWNPCAPVRFVVNTRNAPAGAVEDFKTALAKVDSVTGTDLVFAGTTDAVDERWGFTPGRPVLVNWGRDGEGILNDGAGATSQPVAYPNAAGVQVIVGGQITFSTTEDKFDPGGVFGSYGSRVAMYMHEIAHIMNLDHTDNPDQLLVPTVDAAKDFGAGDLAGLKELTTGACRTY